VTVLVLIGGWPPDRDDWPHTAAEALKDTDELHELVDDLLLARLHVEARGSAVVLGAPSHLNRLITNLIDNACRHAARNRDDGGAGPGLAIARSIAASHGGALTAEAPAGPASGARLVLRLPAADPVTGGPGGGRG
ncbi:hypothetical protein ACWGDE_38885, partial [Streptomyces sp. NPDC054956]